MNAVSCKFMPGKNIKNKKGKKKSVSLNTSSFEGLTSQYSSDCFT